MINWKLFWSEVVPLYSNLYVKWVGFLFNGFPKKKPFKEPYVAKRIKNPKVVYSEELKEDKKFCDEIKEKIEKGKEKYGRRKE